MHPGTAYEAVVTAYISRESTPSAPVSFTTTAVGPGPPASVSSVANGEGGWVVSWTACAGPKCEVPAASWTVIGSSCGTGFIGQAPKLEVRGSQTSVTVNAADDLGLLGDSLSFSVQGVSGAGLVGAPTSSDQCATAWQPPDAAALKLLAAGTPQGQTITADLKLVLASGTAPVLAYGGNQVTYTYSVDGRSFGPTTALEANISGLDPAEAVPGNCPRHAGGPPECRGDCDQPRVRPDHPVAERAADAGARDGRRRPQYGDGHRPVRGPPDRGVPGPGRHNLRFARRCR